MFWGADEGSAVVSVREVGGSEELAEMGLGRDITPVLEVSWSGWMGVMEAGLLSQGAVVVSVDLG